MASNGSRIVNLQALVDWLDALVDDERVSADGIDVNFHGFPGPSWDGERALRGGDSQLTLTLHLSSHVAGWGEAFEWPDFAQLFEEKPGPQPPEPSTASPIHIHITGNTFVGSDPEAAQRIGEEAARVIQARIRRSGL